MPLISAPLNAGAPAGASCASSPIFDAVCAIGVACFSGETMIRRCTNADLAEMESIINEAAQAYHGVIPADCWHEPYMAQSELTAEIAAGIEFWGWHDADSLVGVMGIQKVRDVTLIRHAYVRAAYQGRGIGGALLTALAGQTTGPLLVGTWAAATWAIRFYERHGFRLVSTEEKDRLISTYWKIPQRQQDMSVVLAYVNATR